MEKRPVVLSKNLIDSMIRGINDGNHEELIKILEDLKLDYKEETIIQLCDYETETLSILRMIQCVGLSLFQEFKDKKLSLYFNSVFSEIIFAFHEENIRDDKKQWDSFLRDTAGIDDTIDTIISIMNTPVIDLYLDVDLTDDYISKDLKKLLEILKNNPEYINYLNHAFFKTLMYYSVMLGKTTNINRVIWDYLSFLLETYQKNKTEKLFMLIAHIYNKFVYGCLGVVCDRDDYSYTYDRPLYSIDTVLKFYEDAKLFEEDSIKMQKKVLFSICTFMDKTLNIDDKPRAYILTKAIALFEKTFNISKISDNDLEILSDLYRQALDNEYLRNKQPEYRIKKKKIDGEEIKIYDEDMESNVRYFDFYGGGTWFDPNVNGKKFKDIPKDPESHIEVIDGEQSHVFKIGEVHNISKYDDWIVVGWTSSGNGGTLIKITNKE